MEADQRVAELMRSERVRAALQASDALVEQVVSTTLRLSHVPSPTFQEGQKAELVRRLSEEAGLDGAHIDGAGSVLAWRRGRRKSAVLLAAHIDTIFPIGTPLDGRRDGDYLRGPAVGDNSLGVAALLALPAMLDRAGITTDQDLLLAFDVGEEGLGDLRGMREIMHVHGKNITAAIAIEGHTLGRITHRAVGSRRLRITVTGPGGHSWGDFGRPSAIHVLAGIVTQLTHMPMSREVRSSFNVGRFEGGVSINTIAPTAWCELDVRAEDQGELERLIAWVMGVLHRRQPRGVTVSVSTVGNRPAGALPSDAPIVAVCAATLRALGVEPTFEASSTDANVPISQGTPAVCLGITLGGGAHRTDEFIEVAPIALGLRQLLLVTLALAGAGD